jgi:hypothetical protein
MSLLVTCLGLKHSQRIYILNHKKDFMMLMIERCAMVAIEVLRGQPIEFIHTVCKISYCREQKHI